MNRRAFLAASSGVAVPLVAGCAGGSGGTDGGGGSDGGMDPDGQGGAGGTTVSMAAVSFDPVRAAVDVGTEVTWENEDGFAHTVTSARLHDAAASWSFDERVPGGGSASHRFDSAGVYEYVCTIHGADTMCGAVLVGGASLDAELPCAGGGGGYN